MDLVGAIASVVQLVGLCNSVRKYILQVRTDAKFIPELYRNSEMVLAEIDRLSPELAPEHRQATQRLGVRLREIQSLIEKRIQRKFFSTLLAGINGQSYSELRESMANALQDYHTVTLMQMLHAQTRVSKKLENVVVPRCCGLSERVTESASSRSLARKGELNELWGCGFEAMRNFLAETIRAELDPLRCKLDALGAFDTHRIARGLKLDYGTMAAYLDSIRNSGGYTSDQDIWECFHGILTVFKDLKLSALLRSLTLDSNFERQLRGMRMNIRC
jgi:hypothetical protein